jgi:hypothetical protein
MKTKTMITILIILIFSGISSVQADLIVLTEGYHILEVGEGHEYVEIYNNVILDISGGGAQYIWAYNTSIINFYSGGVGYIFAVDNVIANIYGGNGSNLFAYDNSVINLYNSDSWNHFRSTQNAVLNLYAKDIIYYPYENVSGGELKGRYLLNNHPFTLVVEDDNSLSHIIIVPEPSTLFLLGIGCLLLRRKK